MQRRERLLACPSCDCHVRAHERDCPHCGAPLPKAGASMLGTAAGVAAGLAAFAIGVFGPSGCGPTVSGTGGAGGETVSVGGNGGDPTTTTIASTYGPAPTSVTTTTTSTTISTGDLPTCTGEATASACMSCFAEQYPEGAQIYNDLVVCVICGACYTSCDGANSGCPMPPATPDACDGGMPDMVACGDSQSGCIQCGLAGSCSDELATCQNSQDCVDYATAIGDCPQN